MSDYNITNQKVKNLTEYFEKAEKIMDELYDLANDMIRNKDEFYAMDLKEAFGLVLNSAHLMLNRMKWIIMFGEGE